MALVAGFAFGRTTAPESGMSRLAAVGPESVRQVPTTELDGVAAIAAAVGPAVVQLETGGGLGSGVIYSEEGLILTAAHVLGAETTSLVRLADGRTFQGDVLGAHQPTDIAVVKIEGADLPAAQLGLGTQLEVGELAVALGSPFGFDQLAGDGQRRAGGQLFDVFIIGQFFICHNLNVFQAGAVVDFDEGKPLGISPGAYPSFDQHLINRAI